MENCGFGWQNHVLDSVLTASAQVNSLPATNLLLPQGSPSLGWRAPASSITLTLSSASSVQWRAISLHRTNLSSSATWQIRIGRQAGGNSTWDYAWSGNCSAINRQCVHVTPAEQAGDICEITITDTDNPAGYLDIPLAYAGSLWQPVRNYSTSSTFGRTLGQDSVTSLGGQEFISTRWHQRKYTISHQSLGDADAAVLDQILLAAAADNNILFLPDPGADPTVLSARALYGRLSAGSDLSNPFGAADRHEISLTLTERL